MESHCFCSLLPPTSLQIYESMIVESVRFATFLSEAQKDELIQFGKTRRRVLKRRPGAYIIQNIAIWILVSLNPEHFQTNNPKKPIKKGALQRAAHAYTSLVLNAPSRSEMKILKTLEQRIQEAGYEM